MSGIDERAEEQARALADGMVNYMAPIHEKDLAYRVALAAFQAAIPVRCNSGHESDRRMWDCPVCVEQINDKLDKAVKALESQMHCYCRATLGASLKVKAHGFDCPYRISREALASIRGEKS